MRIVANWGANLTPEELKKFQSHIDELTRIQQERQAAAEASHTVYEQSNSNFQTSTMVLKRKRSDSEISSSSSLLSSPLSSSMMVIDNFHPNQISTPSLFSSRTRKRHRDNRPSESDVHRMHPTFLSAQSSTLIPSTEHTLSLLFSAQQNPQSQHSSPPIFQSQPPVEFLPSSIHTSQQSSLHSFWRIPSSGRQSSPSSNSSSSTNTPNIAPVMDTFQATNCEDCDAALNPADNGDAMDVDMMIDLDIPGGNHACTSCGKQVCHSCSVSNLGAERKCLHCARQNIRVGGFGWMV